jgi:hypothetical protein
MLKIYSIELTNICNLRCDHCPSHGSVYPRGMITPETFEKCLQFINPNTLPIITGFGESLLHPDYDTILGLAKKYNVHMAIHTNGLLLSEEDVALLLDNNIINLEISIHTKKSLAAFKMAYEYIIQRNPKFHLKANIMSCYTDKLQGWINDTGITQDALRRITVINMHNWAMNDREYTPAENLKWQNKCGFLRNNMAVIRWDGRVYTCCVDSEGVNYIGHVDDFPKLTIQKDSYKLCAKCSPAWFNGEIGGTKLPVV